MVEASIETWRMRHNVHINECHVNLIIINQLRTPIGIGYFGLSDKTLGDIWWLYQCAGARVLLAILR